MLVLIKLSTLLINYGSQQVKTQLENTVLLSFYMLLTVKAKRKFCKRKRSPSPTVVAVAAAAAAAAKQIKCARSIASNSATSLLLGR